VVIDGDVRPIHGSHCLPQVAVQPASHIMVGPALRNCDFSPWVL
jgi:hypothetical protein